MKYKHQDFPSDVFLSFESANAVITLVGPDKTTPPVQTNLVDFLSTDLKGKFIYSVTFKQLNFSTKTFFKTFKIMPRYRNAHAYVNAGFNFNINPVTFKVINKNSFFFEHSFLKASKLFFEYLFKGRNCSFYRIWRN